MAIGTINIPVPVTGDGPIVDISSLVGDKTYELTGRPVGSILLYMIP